MSKQRMPLVIPATDSTEIPTISDSSQSSRQGSSSTERHASHGAEIFQQEHATRRIDFVSQLPVEVVSSLIFPVTMTLPFDQAFSYLHVCKLWRQRVLQSVRLHYLYFG
ncbi:hypothetical protein LRAMOSA08997 [Lichtheimia ramosa]|uniref:F-box domain-containing protein n=1 Tax=Lichtheimia ramosa TaxID=688394 RepID=A0A077WH63_9FUNG|nr:hypothetical protein LRAMOSA08997 [Lichtheimia ramosa]